MAADHDASAIVAAALSGHRPADRPQLLRELLAHAAAGLLVIEGDREAAEAVYRLADAIVVRNGVLPFQTRGEA